MISRRYVDVMWVISRWYMVDLWMILYLTTAYAVRHDLTFIKLY